MEAQVQANRFSTQITDGTSFLLLFLVCMSDGWNWKQETAVYSNLIPKHTVFVTSK